MARLIFITHPEVNLDPSVAVQRWRLSDKGLARMRQFAESSVVAEITAVWASTEAKAIEAAGILAARFGLGINVTYDLGENDRSATGYLPPDEFERTADAFFANPVESIRGWERAVDVQQRLRGVVDLILASHSNGDIAIVGHGAAGTLLRSSYLGEPIDRRADQPFQGHYWTATLPDVTVQHGWRPIAPRE